MSSPPTLYVIPGSHAARGGMLMLDHKGIDYRLRTFSPGFHALALRALRFPGRTVPALKIDGRRIQTNHDIARALDELRPEPRLLPADPGGRAAVEEAERFANDVVQPLARRIVFCSLIRDPDELVDRGGSGRLGHLLSRSVRGRRRISKVAARLFRADDEQDRRDRESLPGLLDRVDGYIEAGTLGGTQLNAADLQIAPSLALLMYARDLRPAIDARPAGALVERILPEP